MKKNTIIPAAAVLILLCAAYGLITWHQNTQTGSTDTKEAAQTYITDTGGLTSIEMAKDGKPLSFQKEGETWYYQSDKDCPIRQYTITTLADTLSHLRAERCLDNPDGLKSYGLNTPSIRYTIVSEDGKTQTILIGRQVPGTGDTSSGYANETAEYYACLEGGTQVYTIGTYLTETAAKDLYDFIETETLPYVTGADIKEITVTKAGTTSHFYKKTADTDNSIAWYKNSPDDEANRLPDSAPLNHLAESISGLSITSCVTYKATEEETGSYGLSSPAMTLTWTYERGDEQNTVTLAIGNISDDETGYYTRKDDSKAVNLVSKEAVEQCLNADV